MILGHDCLFFCLFLKGACSKLLPCLNTLPLNMPSLHIQWSCPELPVYSRKGIIGANHAADFQIFRCQCWSSRIQTALQKRCFTQIIPVIWLQCSLSYIGVTEEAVMYGVSVRETGKKDMLFYHHYQCLMVFRYLF